MDEQAKAEGREDRCGAATVIVGPKHFTLCQRLGHSEVAETAAAPGSAERGAPGWDPGRRAPSRGQGSGGAELLAPRLTPARGGLSQPAAEV